MMSLSITSSWTSRDRLSPDATVTSPARKLRVFLVLDHLRRRRIWAKELFVQYNRFIGIDGPPDRGFSDGHMPYFLFVTSQRDRAQAISASLAEVEFRRMHFRVVLRKNAARWLGQKLLGWEEPATERSAA